jgi:hypothetical protein
MKNVAVLRTGVDDGVAARKLADAAAQSLAGGKALGL